ncbi:MAG: hypothetical protein CTY31_03845 [Hyphomicrobium sp.]|nr:MAG: hypothetical protein CTY39_00760 [Hyphomicrobium sp.]PPD01869.1 MAG: hypothetical protein CTY31_03845 [Hyphomicrobium sp.]
MFTLALTLNVAFFLAMVWSSYRHFQRVGREPLGASLLSMATVCGTVMDTWLALSLPTAPSWALLIAILLSVTALMVFFAAIRETRAAAFSLAFSDTTPGAVVSSGVYGVVRHPFYSAYILYWSSWVALTGIHPAAASFCIGMIVAYVFAARKEERLLMTRLDEEYANLITRTWRFIPGVH